MARELSSWLFGDKLITKKSKSKLSLTNCYAKKESLDLAVLTEIIVLENA